MNGQYSEIPETKWNIPENRRQYIIVVLGQMIGHSLKETNHSEESPTRKGREHPVLMKHEEVHPQSTSRMEGYRWPLV